MSTAAGEPLGGPAEEARRLVEALGDWASTRLGTADAHIATGSAECLVCPICTLISALRGDRAEVVARLGDAWTAFLGVLSEHQHPTEQPDRATSSDRDGASGPASQEPDVPVRSAGRSVQNIDVG